MDDSSLFFSIMHKLLPYFPAENRMILSIMLYYMEFSQLFDRIKKEQLLLKQAADHPSFPEGDALLNIISEDLPSSSKEKIKQISDAIKMFEMMSQLNQMGQSDFSKSFFPQDTSSDCTKGEASNASPDFSVITNMLTPEQKENFKKYEDMLNRKESV